MHGARCWMALVTLAFCLTPALAQPSEVISTSQGLPSYSVSSLLQDRTGFLWIGTTLGVARYDGFAMTVYRYLPWDENALSNSIVNTHGLAEDRDGFIWVGTRHGLNRLDPHTGAIRRFFHDPANPASLPDNHIRAVHVTMAGELWVATIAGGASRYDPVMETFSTLRHDALVATTLPSDTAMSLFDTADGVWIGTRHGLALAPADGGSVRRIALDTPEPAIYSLAADGQGRLWAGGIGTVYRLDPVTRAVDRIPLVPPAETTRYVMDLFADHDGTILAGTWGAGLFVLDAGTGRILHRRLPGDGPGSPPSHRVSAFLRDRSGVLWTGTWDGLVRDPVPKPFESRPLPARVSAVMADSDGTVWAATIGDGLHAFAGDEHTVMGLREGLPVLDLMSVFRDRNGALWVGASSGGVAHFVGQGEPARVYNARSTSRPRLRDDLIYKVFEDSRGRIWIGTVHDGLALLDPVEGHVTHFLHDPADRESIPSNEVWTVFEDKRGGFWVGTIGGGLARAHLTEDDAFPPTVRFDRVKSGPKEGLQSVDVVSLWEDAAGALWIGTLGGGLSRLDPNSGALTTWGVSDGLPDPNVTCLLGDDRGYLWIGTFNGLARFDTRNRGGSPVGVTQTYGISDGLPGLVFNADACHRGPDGQLHFGVDNHLLSFDPDVFEDNPTPPKVILNDVLLFNEPLAMDTLAAFKRVLQLESDENFLAFRFAALDFNAPEKNRLEYRMDNVDASWVRDLGGRLASYPNLPAGTYTFRVRGANYDGVVGEETIFTFDIPDHWMSTVWFRGIVTFALLAIVAGFLGVRRERRRELHATRQQIADDLHDDMGSRLEGLALFLNRLLRKDAIAEDDRASTGEHMVAVRHMTDDLADHVWLIEPGYDTLGHFAEQLQASAELLVPAGMLTFTVSGLDTERPLAMVRRRHLFMMAKEAIRNAVRHSEATAVSVELVLEGSLFRVSVIDNGIGFEPASASLVDVLHTIPRRARAIGAQLNVDTSPGNGTVIRIALELT